MSHPLGTEEGRLTPVPMSCTAYFPLLAREPIIQGLSGRLPLYCGVFAFRMTLMSAKVKCWHRRPPISGSEL